MENQVRILQNYTDQVFGLCVNGKISRNSSEIIDFRLNENLDEQLKTFCGNIVRREIFYSKMLFKRQESNM